VWRLVVVFLFGVCLALVLDDRLAVQRLRVKRAEGSEFVADQSRRLLALSAWPLAHVVLVGILCYLGPLASLLGGRRAPQVFASNRALLIAGVILFASVMCYVWCITVSLSAIG